MNLFAWFQSLGFTRNEIKVILLLSLTLLVGLALRQFAGRSDDAREQEFSYAVPDSVFLERSARSGMTPAHANQESLQVRRTRPSKKSPAHPVNINTATKQELMLLPGIGEAYAERIIIYREDNGPFTSIDELEKVKGIGKKKLELVRPHVTIK
jgi:comEA protein